MILVKAPLRLSLLGGGTDYPEWSSQHGGMVLGGAISCYSYVSVRVLPPFHEYKHRFVYRQIELVSSLDEIKHLAIKACLNHVGWPEESGIEVTHTSDLPSRSGTGSSSTFVVALLHALHALMGRFVGPSTLASEAIDIERNRLGESVGCQDQTWAAHGGLNVIQFFRDGSRSVEPLCLSKEIQHGLESHLLMFFTGISRISSKIASTYVNRLSSFQSQQFALSLLAKDGVVAIRSGDWEKLGSLIDQSWRIKSGYSESVSSDRISNIYSSARVCGSFGGKLMGAGGGGCFVMVAPPEKHEEIIGSMSKLGCVPIGVKFCHRGSTVVFSQDG